MMAATRTALAGRSDWGEIQGITRSGIGEDRWYRFYDATGGEATRADAEGWTTMLYKPHGSVDPAKNFLISDADYVEVLTEIDIQTPIPDVVKDRRTERSFLFIGCRFHDQILRTYARQVTKRSAIAALRCGRAREADAERAPVSGEPGHRADRPATGAGQRNSHRRVTPPHIFQKIRREPFAAPFAACAARQWACRLCNREKTPRFSVRKPTSAQV